MTGVLKKMTLMKWLMVGYVVFYMPYSVISRYCEFKQQLGLETMHCGCSK